MSASNSSIFRRGLLAGLLAVAMACAFAGCGGPMTTLSQDNLDKVQPGMSAAQVKAILGEPTDSKTEPIPIVGGNKTTYTYTTKDDSVVIVFKNDNLQTKEGHFSSGQ
jgi:hypothetical protein